MNAFIKVGLPMSWQKDGALRERYAAVQALFEEYYEREKYNLSGRHDDSTLEARDRLRQLVHIVSRLEDLQTFRDSHPNLQDRDKWAEMEVYTEAFYWIAFRLRDVVRNIPGLGSFKSTGVRDVRNKL